jgi:hypothetical protein
MRSALNVRICHLLRVMRVVAPVEWSLGLPFPSGAAIAHVVPAIASPGDMSFSTWFKSRERVRQPVPVDGVERPLAA